MCVPATVSDDLLDFNHTWVIDSGSCVNLVRTDDLTKDEASRIRPVPGGAGEFDHRQWSYAGG